MEQRVAQPNEKGPPAKHQERQPYYHPQTSLGVIGRVVRNAGILAPLIIGEFVKDADKRWRWIRIASVATALISEGLYTERIQRERQERKEERESYYAR